MATNHGGQDHSHKGRPKRQVTPNPDLATPKADEMRPPSYVPVSLRRPGWYKWLRGLLGLRRLPPVVKIRPGGAAMEQDDEEQAKADASALRRGLIYAGSALVFACVVVLGFVAYGMLTRGAPVIAAQSTQTFLSEFARCMEQGDLSGARRVRDQAAAEQPNNPVLHLLDGFLRAKEHPEENAEPQELTRGSWSARATARRLVALAGYRQGRGDLGRCAEALQKAVALQPRDVPLRVLLAATLMGLRNFPEALAQADAVEKLGASPQICLSIRGRAHLGLGDYASARRELEAALAHRPNDPELRLDLAEALRFSGDLSGALRQVMMVRRDYPKSAHVHFCLALVLDAAGSRTEAEKAYRRAIELNPDHALALNNLAYILAAKGQLAEARKLAGRAHRRAPQAAPVLDTLAWIMLLQNQPGKAEPLLRQAVKLDPQNTEAQLHLGQALIALGRKQEAVGPLLAATSGQPHTPLAAQARKVLRQLGHSVPSGRPE